MRAWTAYTDKALKMPLERAASKITKMALMVVIQMEVALASKVAGYSEQGRKQGRYNKRTVK